MAGQDYPLKLVCTAWRARIKRALDFKKTEFQSQANEAMRFFDGPQGWLFEKKYGGAELSTEFTQSDAPQFRMTVNRVSQLVQLMGPKLYPKNPYRSVTPRKYPMLSPYAYGINPALPPNPQDPVAMQNMQMYQSILQQEQARQASAMDGANCLAQALNYTPNELDLSGHTRRVIDECLIKGMGVWWTEAYQPHTMSRKLVGSFWDTCDNLLLDPDAETFDTITWAARRCVARTWEVEERFGLKDGSLKDKGNYESVSRQGEMDASSRKNSRRAAGKEQKDLIVYWEIYSKQGFGMHLPEVQPKKDLVAQLETLGDNCFLAIADGVDYPLNMSNDVLAGTPEEVFDAAQWAIPFWADGRWPFTMLAFHQNPNSIYPLSHIKPAIGELKFLSWAMSFLATKIKNSCKTLVGVAKNAQSEIGEKLFTDDGSGFSVFKFEQLTGKSINEMIQVFNVPGMSGDIWKIIESVNDEVSRQLGIPDILYGESDTQSRSATDANAKQGNASIRSEDMYNSTRQALTQLARNEALASRWLYDYPDLELMLGPQCANYWMQALVPQNLETLVREYDFRIEASNAREPSKETRVEQMNQSVQVLGPVIVPYAQATGNYAPVNALIGQWGDANDIDVSQFEMQSLPPPPPPGAPPGPNGPPQAGGPPPDKKPPPPQGLPQ